MTMRLAFKRVVVGLYQGAPDRTTVLAAAELAGLLRVDLYGLFIEDPGMLGVAGLPGAREYQLLSRCWRETDPDRLSRELELCAFTARRCIDDAAISSGVATRFEIVRAAIGDAIQTVSGSSDIIIIAEPRNPAERTIAPFPQLVAAAFRSEATVLFVPRRIARSVGPVVAVVNAPDDPSIGAAAGIAAAAGETLVVVEAYQARDTASVSHAADLAAVNGLVVERVSLAGGAQPGDLQSLSSALDGFGERLIVITRGSFGEAEGDKPAELASLRGVPILLVEPERASPEPKFGANGKAA